MKSTKASSGIVVILALLTLSCQNEDSIEISDAWVRAMPPSRDVTAAFLNIENGSPLDNALIAAESSLADTVEMHEMTYADEMMKMSPVSEIPLPAGQNTALKPGGYHLMLFGVSEHPAVGDSVYLTLYFKDQSTRIVKAFVQSIDSSNGTRPAPTSQADMPKDD